MRSFLLLLLVGLVLTVSGQRIGNSPYPISTTPDTLYAVYIDGMTGSQQLTVVTLQGLLAKTKPRIMVNRGTTFFKQALSTSYGVTYDSTYQNDFAGLVAHFAPYVSGYILCTLNDSTSNAAISACSSRNAIAVTAADTAIMTANGLPMLLNATGKGQSWAMDSIGATYSDRIVSFQDFSKCTFLSDYSVFAGAFHFTDAMNSPLTARAFGHMKTNSALLGWGNESDLVTTASQYGIHVHAADWVSNLSTFTNFRVQAQQKVHSTDTTIIPGTHTVCFVMTDGDNIQWLMGAFADNTNWYGSPHRGMANIGWTVSPALAELAPTALKCLYDSARTGPGQDYFIAGPSGMGYTYPDHFQPVDSAAAITSRMMGKADLSILNVIGDIYQAQDLTPYLMQPNIDGMLYYSFSDGYSGLGGFATCINDKPMISCRYTMWAGYLSSPLMASVLNAETKDPSSKAGYSLVNVHVWDHNVDSVIACVQRLDSTVRVVTPDAFVKLFKKGTGCRLAGLGINDINGSKDIHLRCDPNPGSDKTNISYHLSDKNFIRIAIYDTNGKEVKTVYAGMQPAGDHSQTLDIHDLAVGAYTISLSGPDISAVVRYEVMR